MPPSPVKATAYTFVLVDHTKAAHSNKGCKVPDKNECVPLFCVLYVVVDCCVRLNVLHSNDLVQLISVPHNTTTGDIRQLVSDAFNGLPVMKDAPASMHGFVWLTKVTHGRGARASLFVNKRGGDFKYQDLEWYVHNAVSYHLVTNMPWQVLREETPPSAKLQKYNLHCSVVLVSEFKHRPRPCL